MNYKKDDAGFIRVNIKEAVACYNYNRELGQKITQVQLIKMVHPDWSDNYIRSVISHWKKGNPKYRPSKTDINRIEHLINCNRKYFTQKYSPKK